MPTYEEDLAYDVREIRIQAAHVEGEEPTLAYVTVFLVTESGQWKVLVHWDCGPFDGPEIAADIDNHLHKLVHQLLA